MGWRTSLTRSLAPGILCLPMIHHDAPAPSTDITDRLVIAGMKKPLPPVARRAVIEALDLIAYAVGAALTRLRSSADPVMAAQGRIQEMTAALNLHGEIARLLAERWDRIPAARRRQPGDPTLRGSRA